MTQQKSHNLIHDLEEYKEVANQHLNDSIALKNVSFFQSFFNLEVLSSYTWADFQKLGEHLHCFQSMAIARGNALGKPNHSIEHYRKSFIYLAFGEDDLVTKIDRFTNDSEYSLHGFGKSAISEICAYLFPNQVFMRNRRNDWAGERYGLAPAKKKGATFAQKLLAFCDAMQPLVKDYQKIVGIQTDLAPNLEVDQFLSYLYDRKKSDKVSENKVVAVGNQDKRYWIYSPGRSGKHWEEFYNKGIAAIGWDELGDLQEYPNKKAISEKLQELDGTVGSKSNNALANYQFSKVMVPGDVILAKNGHSEFIGYGIVSSEYYFDQSREYYQSCRKVDWRKKGKWSQNDWPIVAKTLTDITKYHDYVIKIKKMIGITDNCDVAGSSSFKERVGYPLNTILYGPPGTGKTYNTVLRAAEIVENRKIIDFQEAKEIFNSNLGERIEFITFHQNYSYEDFIQGLRPDVENDGNLAFERKDGIFKVISDRALRNLQESEKPGLEKKSFDEVLKDFLSPLVDGERDELEVHMKKVSFFITSVSPRSISFRKANGDSAHKLGIQTLRKMYEVESVLDIQGLYPYYQPLLERLLSLGKYSSTSGRVVPVQNYVIVIDEINRANISRVFGELITLIEPDKRSGGSLPLKCKLPSGESFVVPSNLYIIGTMNTADKSIALLDIALRRRFEFVAMYPKYSIDNFEIHNVDILQRINEEIIERKGHDFQIGHSYFMGKNWELVHQMNSKVIPLLVEYFMNDKKEVEEILIKAGLKVQKDVWPLRITK